MVGVAGKSKGCTTCRRRKIRCSQETPHCLNCTRTGRSCEGYERYPVFINRTARGVQKRNPLEETKPGPSTSRPTDDVADNTTTGPVPPTGTASSVIPIPSGPSTQTIWSTGFVSWFWEHYSPAHSPVNASLGGPAWLYYVMNIPHPTAVLRHSLLALSVVRFGREREDEALINKGRSTYGMALNRLQKAIYDPLAVSHEETLAATRALILYEVCFSSGFQRIRSCS